MDTRLAATCPRLKCRRQQAGRALNSRVRAGPSGRAALSPRRESPRKRHQPGHTGTGAGLCAQGGGGTAQRQGLGGRWRGSLSRLWTPFHSRVKTQQAVSLRTRSVSRGNEVSVVLKGSRCRHVQTVSVQRPGVRRTSASPARRGDWVSFPGRGRRASLGLAHGRCCPALTLPPLSCPTE